MQGSTNGVIWKIKTVSPDCVSNHSMIYQEALVLKKFKHGTSQHCDLATGYLWVICHHFFSPGIKLLLFNCIYNV